MTTLERTRAEWDAIAADYDKLVTPANMRLAAAVLSELAHVTKRRGGILVLTHGPLEESESFAFFVSAVQTVSSEAAVRLQAARLQLSMELRNLIAKAGLNDLRVRRFRMDLMVRDGKHLWDLCANGDPGTAQIASGLTSAQQIEVQHVLSSMLRERSGARAAVLTETIDVAISIK
jgi:hypothetical protein